MWLAAAALEAGCNFTERQIARIVASSSLPAAGRSLLQWFGFLSFRRLQAG